jgi:hypothetical protein
MKPQTTKRVVFYFPSLKEIVMAQVLKAFRSLLVAGEPEITATEFSAFWKSCDDMLKAKLVVNAAELGFKA